MLSIYKNFGLVRVVQVLQVIITIGHIHVSASAVLTVEWLLSIATILYHDQMSVMLLIMVLSAIYTQYITLDC